ncbi:MAG TPA: glycosyltransferase family 39 protein [Gemmataceae bacterium]|nr:glycosyltransferase family 39 protein [Gemmataceae bacterium]
MEEPQTPQWSRLDIWLIALLVLLTLGLRTYQLATTEVTARDSIGYIHIAWRMEHGDWLRVIPASPQHPGYPVALLAASVPARLFFPQDLPYAMQLGAQLASAAAGVLLVAPLYWLGRQLFGPRAAFGAVLIFQCLPCSGRILADGLSEGVFLLFAITALAAAMHALRSGSVRVFAVAGAAGALAYLTRPEGLLIPAVAGLMLLAMQFIPVWRRPWRRVLACGGALTVAVLLIGGPYMVLIRGLTVKNSSNAVMRDAGLEADRRLDDLSEGPPLAMWWQGAAGDSAGRALWGLKTFGEVLSKAFFYVLWAPALAGLFWFHRRFRAPGAWLMLIVSALLAGLLYMIAARMGYLSDRHMILILACGLPWAAAALDGAACVLASRLEAMRPTVAGRRWADGRVWAVCLLAAAAAAPLWRTLEPLHGDRVGFREAGHWLAQNIGPSEQVFDPFGWAGYYAGRYFRHEDAVNTPCQYVVLEVGASHHSHLATVAEAQQAAGTGHEIHRFAAERGSGEADVVIYRLPAPWVTRPLP